MANVEQNDPFAIVAQAIGCDKESLSNESRMYRDHGWDSFGHVSVVLALEKAYGISISDNEIEEYQTMVAILALHNRFERGASNEHR